MELDVSGVYKIRNTVNGRFYIGSAVNIRKRWNHHLTFLRKGKHHSRHLQCSFNKYGSEAFTVEVLEVTTASRNALIEREQHYLDTLRPYRNSGYNVCRKAGSTLGVKHTKAVREKVRRRMLGNIPWNKGRKRPPFSEEWKRNLARLGETNPFYGKQHSSETKQKISDRAKERYRLDPSKNYFLGKRFTGAENGMFGRTHSADARQRIGAPHKGKKLSSEHIETLRRATALRCAKAVEQLGLDGVVIFRHRSLGDAALAINTSSGNLSVKIRSSNPIFRGYHWRYAT